MDIEDLLNISMIDFKEKAQQVPVELHPTVAKVRGGLSLKGAARLVQSLINDGAARALHAAYRLNRTMDARGLATIGKDPGSSIAAVAVSLALLQGLQEGSIVSFDFPRALQAATIDDPKVRYRAWIAEQIRELTDEIILLSPSEWAEDKRYLPPEVTSMPGPFSFDVCPFWREPLDCMSPESPVRIVDILKGVQVCYTVGVLENAIGYAIDHLKNAPVMLLTADAELAKIRVDNYIIPMLQHSGLSHLIQSNDLKNSRKTGQTKDQLQWQGGGFLVPFGAQNANKLRSISIQILLQDEVDGFPQRVGKDGKPAKLAEDRTAAYESSRKIFRGSTPLIKQTSVIWAEYKQGDQRKYEVPCLHCGRKQPLVWTGEDADGKKHGITFETDERGNLVHGSVCYVCKYCGGVHTNDDKSRMLPEGEWVPTAKPVTPQRRSYHISALYSPVGMQTWESWALKWCECWDVKAGRVKDVELLQQFYNNGLGLPFEARGEALKLATVTNHRRVQYVSGEVPNALAVQETGSAIELLVCAVDVHKEHLDVQVIGFCPDKTFYSVDYKKFLGDDCRDTEDAAWRELADFVESNEYLSDDRRRSYRVQLTLIDSQYANDAVLQFCSQFSQGVFPISGREAPPKNARIREFQEYVSRLGIMAFNVTTTIYKDRLSAALRREWSGIDRQTPGTPNFPRDYPESFFKELTAERKVEKINATTGVSMGFYWHRPSGAPNHSWDLTVYCMAALDMVCYDKCTNDLELEEADWSKFWELAANGYFYAALDGVGV